MHELYNTATVVQVEYAFNTFETTWRKGICLLATSTAVGKNKNIFTYNFSFCCCACAFHLGLITGSNISFELQAAEKWEKKIKCPRRNYLGAYIYYNISHSNDGFYK